MHGGQKLALQKMPVCKLSLKVATLSQSRDFEKFRLNELIRAPFCRDGAWSTSACEEFGRVRLVELQV